MDPAFAHSLKEVHEILAHALVILATFHAGARSHPSLGISGPHSRSDAASFERVALPGIRRRVYGRCSGWERDASPDEMAASSHFNAGNRLVDVRGVYSLVGSAVDARKRCHSACNISSDAILVQLRLFCAD
jgi:hypothetical protein